MSAIFWFEIPVHDIERACTFYSALLQTELTVQDLTETMHTRVAHLPARGGIGGMLTEGPEQGYTPGPAGVLIYLNLDGDLDDALARVEAAGGQVLLPKTGPGPAGWLAWIQDSEGNRIGIRTPGDSEAR